MVLAVVGQGNEALAVSGHGDRGDAIVERALIHRHQHSALRQEDGYCVCRVAIVFLHLLAVDGVAEDFSVHGVTFFGVVGYVVGNPEIVFARCHHFLALDGKGAVGLNLYRLAERLAIFFAPRHLVFVVHKELA